MGSELLRAGERWWGARGHGQQLWRSRRQNRRRHPGAPDLGRGPRSFEDRQYRHRSPGQPTADAVILVVNRTGVMVMVRVGAGLIRQIEEDPPAGILSGARLARRCVTPQNLMKLVESWRSDPGQIEHQQQSCTVSHAARPARLKNSTTHLTEPASDPAPSSDDFRRMPMTAGLVRSFTRDQDTGYHESEGVANDRKRHHHKNPRGDFFLLLLDARYAD